MIQGIVENKQRTMDNISWLQAMGLLFLAKCEPGLTCEQAWGRVTNATQSDNLASLKGKRTQVAVSLWHAARLGELANVPIGVLYHELDN